MSPDLVITLVVLAAAVALFASDRVRLDFVARLVLLALMLAGVLAPPAALAGFSDPVVLMIAALLVAPIAISAAIDVQVAPQAFAMTVAIAASAAFMTPVSSPVNTLIMSSGGYRFLDFVKVGVRMTLLVMVITLVVIPMLFPYLKRTLRRRRAALPEGGVVTALEAGRHGSPVAGAGGPR